MSSHNQELGAKGEALAAQFLIDRGIQILARNLKTRYGEVDILAKDDDTLVIIEVKAKSSDRYGLAVEMIGAAKRGRLQRLATILASQYNMVKYRIDIISVDGLASQPRLDYFPSAC